MPSSQLALPSRSISSSQLIPAGVVFAPRFLYLPLLFGVAGVGAVMRRLPSIFPGVVVLVLVIAASIRCNVYADVERYNRAVLAHVPNLGKYGAVQIKRMDTGAVRTEPVGSFTWHHSPLETMETK